MRDTRRTITGFVVSLLLHLLIFLLFFLSFDNVHLIPPPSSKEPKKITLNLSRFTPPAPKPKPVSKPKPISKPLPKPVPSKPKPTLPIPKPVETPKPPVKTAQKKHLKKKKGFEVAKVSKEENNATKIAKKEAKKRQKQPKKKIVKRQKKTTQKHVAKKQPLPKQFRLPKRSKDKLANALLNSGRTLHQQPARRASSGADRMISRLYGKEFYSFTKTQKKFIRNHLSEIYRITQNTLYINGYPEVAIRTHQQGVNVVSFYLHPDGSISNLRLIKPMGYEALDKNTIAVIQIAYKDYPRPKTKTKIVFYVNYQLY
ncbi:MAG TPA: energy transducer TonB [Epsilonproteobacteria bacterium]|nr:energy transducer TonB [Campylobacterota bacterium]